VIPGGPDWLHEIKYETNDMIEQHNLLNRAAALFDDGVLRHTMKEDFGPINATNLRRAHVHQESGRAIGKSVLIGFWTKAAAARSKRRRKFIAGNNDKIVSPSTQSDRLHGVTRQSKLRILPKTGHMVHYAMRDAVMEAIYEVAAAPAVL
jgi:pimeloyl-ACP methyl ester carboxylesterase